MKAQSAYQRVVEGTRTEYAGGPRMPEEMDYANFNCRYGVITRMIRAGYTDQQIRKRFPTVSTSVLMVYRKIEAGAGSKGRERLNKTTATRTADGKRAKVTSMMLNGHDADEIARVTGLDRKTVIYYMTGHHPKKRKE